MASEMKKAFVEQIRREKFGIGTTKSNPLAGMLHEAIVHLSAELYQKDIHFISELLQNAEDNSYGKGVTPSLELVLTREDIAGVGAPATLILFNNEVGFQPQHVEALCAVGLSTKKGKRNSGYIGEKGIGFKSVFLVTRSPYVISNGYRIRFTDQANNEAKIGYVVPEWVESPTDADLKRVYGKQQLPQTMIILPLRPDKVKAVRDQLKQVSPETLLFLSQLRQVTVREDSGDLRLCITRSDLFPTTKDDMYSFLYPYSAVTVNLSVGRNEGHISEQCQYHLVQQKFPVTHPVQQRREVEKWVVTVAFPGQERINSGRCSGDIYAFLPSELSSGFPFIVNADFLLVSSRETLKFESPWNVGILSCIPNVFATAFDLFLKKSSTSLTSFPDVAVQHVYRYVPVKAPQITQLRTVQTRILDDLRKRDVILVESRVGYTKPSTRWPAVSCNLFCKPTMGRIIQPEFRSILEAAYTEKNVHPTIGLARPPWFVVDSGVQDCYSLSLQTLGVPQMTDSEYIDCIKHSDWLFKLSEDLYLEILYFVYSKAYKAVYSSYHYVPILKYCREDGSIALASIDEAKSPQGVKIYMCPSEKGKWLSEWTSEFKPWVYVHFMPKNTVQTLEQRRKSVTNMSTLWTYLGSIVCDLSVRSYLLQLLGLLRLSGPTSKDPKFIILTTEFMYQCIRGNHLELKDIKSSIPAEFPIVDDSGCIQTTQQLTSCFLLPARGSKWPTLSVNSWYSEVIPLSNDYLNAPSLLSSSRHEDPELHMEAFRSYLESVVGAADLPHIIPPKCAPLRMPEHLRSKLTIEQACLLLKWVTCYIESVGRAYHGKNFFLDNLKETHWVPTEEHGLRRASSCFDRSSFSAFFKPSDVPYVNSSLSAFSVALETLGVVTDPQKGYDAVITYIIEISHETAPCALARVTRLYTYLQTFLGKFAYVDTHEQKIPKIFVPGTEKSAADSWKTPGSCVIHNVDGFLDGSLTVLEDLYPKSLLPFFAEVLGVPEQATVERYCEIWMKWRSDVHDHEVTAEEGARVWRIISEKWKSCDADVWRTFLAKAWVPSSPRATSGGTGTVFQLSSPSICFIADDLDLRSLFLTSPNMMLQFVWYPDSSEKTESLLNEVYIALGVKNLSLSVQSKLIINVTSQGPAGMIQDPRITGKGILCQEFFRAILGFLARKKYGLTSSERQALMNPLKKVVDVTISSPFTRSSTISSLPSPIVVTQENVMALWSKAEGKLFCLDRQNPILEDSLTEWDYRTQLASTIANGLLSDRPPMAEELTEFINLLLCSGFESSVVEYELKRKNAKLYAEDELFLSQPLCGQLEGNGMASNKKTRFAAPFSMLRES